MVIQKAEKFEIQQMRSPSTATPEYILAPSCIVNQDNSIIELSLNSIMSVVVECSISLKAQEWVFNLQ